MMRGTVVRHAVTAGYPQLPPIVNEPMLSYAPGSVERTKLLDAIRALRDEVPDVPVVVAGKEYRPGQQRAREVPSDRKSTFHTYWHADRPLLEAAVRACGDAWERWSVAPFETRAGVFLKAAQLLTTKYRYRMMAATMLGQSKNIWQAEIECMAELADFFRFNVLFADSIYRTQPISPVGTVWNRTDYRPLEGFVLAISPFNFTAIGGNLAGAPALMGNTVVWKPSDDALYSNYLIYKILEEAGLPPGVINFTPALPQDVNDVVVRHPSMAALAFTGSTAVMDRLWQEIGSHVTGYRTYPRIVAESGGKNFHVVHPTADMSTVVAQTVRSAFEYQGQKCSACSRLYVPSSCWAWVSEELTKQVNAIKVGGPEDPESFMCAVISEASFEKSSRYLAMARADPSCRIVAGGSADRAKGWFVSPTVIVTTDFECRLLKEEIFGPVLTCYVYDDDKPTAWHDLLVAVNGSVTYGLTGAIFAGDRAALMEACHVLRHAAGNVYLNDKSTGAVVGQQPFGGSRRSGTNDKPGGPHTLLRFVSPRSIKEALEPCSTISYPHQHPTVAVVPPFP